MTRSEAPLPVSMAKSPSKDSKPVRTSLLSLLLLLLATPDALAQKSELSRDYIDESNISAYDRGMRAGQLEAEDESLVFWKGGSFVSGAALSVVGAGLAYGVAQRSRADEVDQYRSELIEHVGRDYWKGFERGYRGRIGARRRRAALVGGLAGAVLGTAVYFIAR